MRWLGRFIGGLFALLVIGYGSYVLSPTITTSTVNQAEWEKHYTAFTTYVVEPNQTLTFDVPNDAQQLRILHTPIGPIETQEQVSFTFAVSGQPTLTTTYQYQYTPMVLPAGSDTSDDASTAALPARFFDAPDNDIGGITKFRIVSIDPAKDFNRFTLTLADAKRPFAIRVAVLEQYDSEDIARVWRRMPDERRADYFQDHIYPTELVPAAERNARLSLRWRPIGPSEYSQPPLINRTLFVDERAETQESEQPPLNELAVIGPARWLTIEPLRQGVNSIACRPLTDTTSVQLQISYVTEQGQAVNRIEQVTGSSQVTLSDPTRRYRLAANVRCELLAYDAQGQPVALPSNYVRSARVSSNDSVTYSLVAAANDKQPLRLDTRLLTQSGANISGDLRLNWTVADAKGQQLLSGQVTPPTMPNPYQQAVDANLTTTVHEKVSTFIVAPATAATLTVTLNQPSAADVEVLANLYTRPLGLPYRVVPEPSSESNMTSPKWFLAQPQIDAVNRAAATRLLVWQQPLAEVIAPTPRITAASTEPQWQRLQSLEQAPYYELFVPTDSPAAAIEPAFAFVPIAAQQSTYTVVAEDHEQAVTPQLVYNKATNASVPFSIYVNGTKLRDDWLYADTGKLYLTRLPQGEHQLTLSTPKSVQWFSNYQNAQTQPLYRVRGAYALTSELNFAINKQVASEWVTFNYFPANPAAHQVTLSLEKLERVGVYSDFTVATRIYSINQQALPASVSVLNQRLADVWPPIRLAFPLAADLAPGRYRIKLTSSLPNAGFVQAGYLLESNSPSVTLYKEVNDAAY